MSTRNAATICLLLVGLLSLQCSSNGDPSGHSNSRPPTKPRPFTISLGYPYYLQTSFPANSDITLSLLEPGQYSGYAEVALAVQKEVVIEKYPSQEPLSGTWSAPGSYVSFFYFKPSASLAPGDYLIRVPNAGPDLLVHPQPFNLFRVGSLLRVTMIELLKDKPSASNDLVHLNVHYSEPVPDGVSPSVEIAQAAGTAWTVVSGTPATTAAGTRVTLAKPVDPTKLLRVAVSAPQLDGQWKGVAGSGPLTVEFLPSANQWEAGQVEYYVRPSLSVALPPPTVNP